MKCVDLRRKLEGSLRKLPRTRPKGFLENYVGNNQSTLEFLGLSSPQVREVAKELKSLNLSLSQIRKIYLSTNIFEVRSLLLSELDRVKTNHSPDTFFAAIKPLATSIDNWAHSDSLSDFYSYCLEQSPKTVLPVLKKWNVAREEWLIRQSLVSLLYYSSKRKKHLPFSTYISFVVPHLGSSHKFVQKGVGWTLREIRNVYEAEADRFLKANIHSLKSYAFSASTEKMSKSKKAELLALRKRSRK